MLLLNILIYIGFALIMSYLAVHSFLYFCDNQRWNKYLQFYILFFTIICAIRWNVGVDSISYAKIFEYGDSRKFGEINGEVLFHGFAELLSRLNIHFSIGLGICAFAQIFPITKALKDYQYILITLPFVLFGSRYFLDLNNGVRQMIVASIFVYASRFIVDKKPWHYLAFIIGGSLIHQSTYMLLPFYFIPSQLCIANKRRIMLIVFTLCFIAGQTPSFQNYAGYIENLINILGYESYATRATLFLKQGKTSEALAFGPMMLSYVLIVYYIIWFGPYLKKRYEDKIPYFNIWYNFSFFYACTYFLVCNISHIFIRPVQYFELFQMIIASLLLYEFRYSEFRNQLLYISFICIIWVNISWNVIKSYGLKRESTIYKTFLFHQEEVQKEFSKHLKI